MASGSWDFKNGQVIPEHSHPEDQLVYASKGVMTVRTNQGVWVVPPLPAVWIPAKTPHSVAMSGPVSMRTLYFLPRLGRALPKKCFVMNVSPLLRELILHACRFPRLSQRSPAHRTIIEIIVDQLEEVHSIPVQLPHPSDARARRVAQGLLKNPGDQRTLEELCQDCGASKRTVQRLFVRETQMTFGKWRQQFRPAFHAIAGFRRESDGSRAGGGVHQRQGVHIHVSQGFARFRKVSQGFARFRKVSQGFASSLAPRLYAI